MNKKERITAAKEHYKLINNLQVETEKSITKTKIFKINVDVPPSKYEEKYEKTEIEVVGQSVVTTSLKEFSENVLVTILNVSSATNPCGEWLTGGIGQEESLAASTTLYLSLQQSASKMYELNENNEKNGYYQDLAVYTPNVIFLRNIDGVLLDKQTSVSVISVPAVNSGRVLEHAKKKRLNIHNTEKTIDKIMKSRCVAILKIAAKYETQILILTAYGCGDCKNNPHTIAWVFKNLLGKEFKGVFKKVIFSIQDKVQLESFENMF
jgi:uncharacterized protein (TIGR02452 family)